MQIDKYIYLNIYKKKAGYVNIQIDGQINVLKDKQIKDMNR